MSMEQRQRRREGSQRAQAARERRQQALKRRQSRKLLYGAVAALAVAAAVAALVVFSGRGPDVGTRVAALGGGHSPPYVYNSRPPTSGNHLPATSQYGFLGGPLVAEAVVHNMEHGALVIWYQPGDPDLAGQVNGLVRELGNQCLVAGSYAGMESPLVATVWGRMLELEQLDREQLLAFIRAYRGKSGPEAGLCRGQS